MLVLASRTFPRNEAGPSGFKLASLPDFLKVNIRPVGSHEAVNYLGWKKKVGWLNSWALTLCHDVRRFLRGTGSTDDQAEMVINAGI